MRTSVRAMIAVAALAIGLPAHAGEGDGPDFPGLLQPHAVLANPTISQTGSESYPVAVGTVLNPVVTGGIVLANGSEGIVQSPELCASRMKRPLPIRSVSPALLGGPVGTWFSAKRRPLVDRKSQH
ncbi:MAG: hypothetical protein JOY71_01670 [Acetobacteraceae bacterium]|nr:hypothetical protein [Acetobacteraceae bacterium]